MFVSTFKVFWVSKRLKYQADLKYQEDLQISKAFEFPGDGSCFASSSWAPRPAAAFRSGIADVRFA
jgi:hypothetical protein